ncbi:MAG: DUF420 domain-containing protein [Halobacteriota archaeon]
MPLETARNHVALLTALCSIVALALVFGAVLGWIPPSIVPRSDPLVGLVPHVNVGLSLAAIGTILAGWRSIKRGAVEAHRALMIASFGLFATFLLLYLYRVTLEGPADFPGPETVYTIVYLPTLAIHILLAIVCVPFVFYALLLATTRPVSELYDTRHRFVGRIAASLWLISFTLGIVVYLLLYVVY